MGTNQEFDCFVEQLLSNAINDFKTTEQYKLWQEKLARMYTDCETMVNPSGQEFVTGCFELLSAANDFQENYIYRRGLLDCVKLLKLLGVLA